MSVLYVMGIALTVASLLFCFTQYRKVLPAPLGLAGSLLVAVFYVASDRPGVSVIWFVFAAIHGAALLLPVLRPRRP